MAKRKSGAKTVSETKPTPGPWTATDPYKWLANTSRYTSSIRYGATNLGTSIAEVYLGGPGALNCDAESVKANARLIAAAPDLLEALENLVRAYRALYPDDVVSPSVAKAQAAIRKATEQVVKS
jgi:hypothetical protein